MIAPNATKSKDQKLIAMKKMFVPKRMTYLFQPGDVIWFAIIKMVLGEK
jgi:hypothetical protein